MWSKRNTTSKRHTEELQKDLEKEQNPSEPQQVQEKSWRAGRRQKTDTLVRCTEALLLFLFQPGKSQNMDLYIYDCKDSGQGL